MLNKDSIRLGKGSSLVSPRIRVNNRSPSRSKPFPVAGGKKRAVERKDEWMRKMTEDEEEEEEEKGGGGSGKERHGEEENGEKRANHTRCGEGERRYSYIVITRRARSTAECQRCLGTRNEKATHGGKRSSRIRLRLERHEREKQEEVGESAVGLRRRRRRRRTSAARSQPA